MRWPWVSLERYDALLDAGATVRDQAEARAKNWQGLYEAERVRCDRLVEKLLTLKQSGFTTATERQAPAPVPPSKLDDAIAEKAGPNAALRRHLTRWAAQRQSMNVPEDEIADALLNWRDPDSEGEES